MTSILERKTEIGDCIKAHKSRARPGGFVRVHFAIDDRGGARDVRVIQTDADDPELLTCLTGFISRMNFPLEASGREVDFPFSF